MQTNHAREQHGVPHASAMLAKCRTDKSLARLSFRHIPPPPPPSDYEFRYLKTVAAGLSCSTKPSMKQY